MEIVVVIAVLLLLIAGPVVVVNRDLLLHRGAARHAAADVPLPFLIIPSFPGASDIVPASVAGRRSPDLARPEARWAPRPDFQPDSRPAMQPAPERAAAPNAQPTSAPAPVMSAAARTVERQTVLDDWGDQFVRSFDKPDDLYAADDPDRGGVDEEEIAPDATVVFSRPVDEPIQILPGHLRVLSGDEAGEDLRLFSRIGETPQIVVGRETGPAHRHITLRSPTVSRRHALMDYSDGQWSITNLSETNPVLVNDRVLNSGGSPRKLADGDRIELGEVALRFLGT